MNQSAFQLEDLFPDGFWHWLRKNAPVYSAFERMALEMAMSGRKHYGAKSIVEVLRYETDVRDSEVTFKLNNSYTSGMARLWMETYGERFPQFFQLRDSLGR